MPKSTKIFSCLRLPERTTKPRTTGLTMVEGDYMLSVAGMNWLQDLVEWGGAYMDYYKVGPSMIFQPRDLVNRKLAFLKEHNIQAYLGGNITEEAVRQGSFEAFWEEVKGLGIDTIEVSDTVQPMSMEGKIKLIRMAKEKGLTVFAEIGKKLIGVGGPNTYMPISEVIRQMKECLNAGAFKVVYELTEIVELREKGEGLGALLEVAGSVDPKNIMFEVPIAEWREVSPYVSFFVEHFGPNVNIGDVDPRHLLQIQCGRMGLSVGTFGKVPPI